MTTPAPWRSIAAIARRANPQPWICRQCLHQQPQKSSFSTSQRIYTQAGKRAWRERMRIPPKERRKVAIAAAVIFVAGSSALAFSDRARHTYVAAERSGRVGVTLAVCVSDYYRTLKKGDDPDFKAILSACHTRCANRALEAMEKNGSIFIKLGQHLSSLNYLLPNEWCETFIPLQDRCPVSSFASIEAMVKKDTGKTLDDYFDTFEVRPIGAASLAQVHIATLKGTGEKVAVKVQHPSLDEWSKLDLALTRFTFATLKYWFPEYDLTWLSDEMEISLPMELDFRQEGTNAIRAKKYFSHLSHPLVIPEVKWAQRRILVMEYITGHRPDDLAFLDANGISRDEVSAALARVFNEMIFGTDAPLHCDPHGGNLAIRVDSSRRKPRNFEIVLYDHGLYRDIPQDLRRAYAHMWLAVLDQDEPAMRRYAHDVAGIGEEEFPIFASAITGRDYSVITSASGVASARNSSQEKEAISSALNSSNLLEQLVHLLSRVPRVILLILKTNDLTRSLDENLQTREGPVRTFMILARYAARTVFEESVEGIRGSLVWPNNLWTYTVALASYGNVVVRLGAYEYYLSARRRLGYRAELM